MNLKTLIQWFSEEKRDLPWRHEPLPYHVWVSEVMLQQTQVAVVIPYYLRWMKQFPDIQSLAKAPREEVIKAWEGMGYYSRARNLHESAQHILKEFNGELPACPHKLSSIKGIGPYTLGAILSFAFHKRAVAIDGNVVRVMSRYHAFEGEVTKAESKRFFEKVTLDALPHRQPWIVMEALIELGAKICTKQQPKCTRCPLQRGCRGYFKRRVQDFPVKNKNIKYKQLNRCVILLITQGSVLAVKEMQNKIMQDLYEFPYFQTESDYMAENEIYQLLEEKFSFYVHSMEKIPVEKQSFTRFRVKLYPVLCYGIHKKSKLSQGEWIAMRNLNDYSFSSGHRRLANFLMEHVK